MSRPNPMARWLFPCDRHTVRVWLRAPRRGYAISYDPVRDHLVLKKPYQRRLFDHGAEVYRGPIEELWSGVDLIAARACPAGWRWYVAQKLRELRRVARDTGLRRLAPSGHGWWRPHV